MMEQVKALGRVINRHRLFFVLVVGLLTIGVYGGLLAIQENATFSGQTAVGDHDWWQDIGTNAFCENCHTGVAGDIAAGPHSTVGLSTCSVCHTPGGADHAAAAAACTDCHASEGAEVASPTEAHSGILADLGETATAASQTCQSCHTHVEVNIIATAQPPIELIMGN